MKNSTGGQIVKVPIPKRVIYRPLGQKPRVVSMENSTLAKALREQSKRIKRADIRPAKKGK